MLNSSMSCDNCEQLLPLDYDPDTDGHEQSLEAGWITIITPEEDYDHHLCCERCLTIWAAARALSKGTVELG